MCTDLLDLFVFDLVLLLQFLDLLEFIRNLFANLLALWLLLADCVAHGVNFLLLVLVLIYPDNFVFDRFDLLVQVLDVGVEAIEFILFDADGVLKLWLEFLLRFENEVAQIADVVDDLLISL